MAKKLQLRGGTTVQHSTFTGALREVTVDTDKDTIVVHDGATAGGFSLARDDDKRDLPIAKGVSYTAVDGDSLLITAGSITITLPATPTAGDTVMVKDGTGAAADTSWTVARNGSNIASDASDLTFDKNWAEITMTYIDATVGWSV